MRIELAVLALVKRMEFEYCPEVSRVLVPRNVIFPVFEQIADPSPINNHSLSFTVAAKAASPVTEMAPDSDLMNAVP